MAASTSGPKLFTIDLDPPGGGLLIKGTQRELLTLAEGIASVATAGEGAVIALVLTADGVEIVSVCVADAA